MTLNLATLNKSCKHEQNSVIGFCWSDGPGVMIMAAFSFASHVQFDRHTQMQSDWRWQQYLSIITASISSKKKGQIHPHKNGNCETEYGPAVLAAASCKNVLKSLQPHWSLHERPVAFDERQLAKSEDLYTLCVAMGQQVRMRLTTFKI